MSEDAAKVTGWIQAEQVVVELRSERLGRVVGIVTTDIYNVVFGSNSSCLIRTLAWNQLREASFEEMLLWRHCHGFDDDATVQHRLDIGSTSYDPRLYSCENCLSEDLANG